MTYAKEDLVRLMRLDEVLAVARKAGLTPLLHVGDVGRVIHDPAPDGLFEVRFDACVIICNEAMVERVLTGIEKEALRC